MSADTRAERGVARAGHTCLAHLPIPATNEGSLAHLIAGRRARREFGPRPLTGVEIGLLLWAGQGITGPDGGRAAPSAGALYPVTLTLVDARGVWRYHAREHALEIACAGDCRSPLAAAAFSQEFIAKAPITIAVSARPAVLEPRYAGRAERYCVLEAGHVAQNVLLMATELGLASVPVGAFDDVAVLPTLKLGAEHLPLYLLPVGAPLTPRPSRQRQVGEGTDDDGGDPCRSGMP